MFWFAYRRLVDFRKPKPLRPVPDEVFITELQVWFLEYTQIKGWCEEHLKVENRWWYHYRVCNNYANLYGAIPEWKYSVYAIDEVLDIPVPNHSWKRIVNRDNTRFTFSFLLKLRDKVIQVFLAKRIMHQLAPGNRNTLASVRQAANADQLRESLAKRFTTK